MSNWSVCPTYTISEAEYLKNQNKSNELTHYDVEGMKWGVRKDLAKAKLSKSFNEARYSKPIQIAVNTKVGKAAKKALYTTFDVKIFDDLAVKVGKMAGSPKDIAAYASIKNSGVLKKTHV